MVGVSSNVKMFGISVFCVVFISLSRCVSGDHSKITMKCVPNNATGKLECSVVHDKEEDTSYIAEVFFMSLILLFGLSLNIVVAVGISGSLTLRKFPYNILFFYIVLASIFELVLNCGFSIAYISTAPWRFFSVPCNLNAFWMEWTPILISFYLLVLTLDRWIALKIPHKYHKWISVTKVHGLCLILCFLSLGVAFPVVLDAVPNAPFPTRYSCSIHVRGNRSSNATEQNINNNSSAHQHVSESGEIYTYVVFLLLLLLPITVAALLIIGIVVIIRRENQEAAQKHHHNRSYTDHWFRSPKLIRESIPTKVTGGIFVLFCLLFLPNILTTNILNLVHDYGLKFVNISNETSVPTTANETDAALRGYVPEISNGLVVEKIFTWLRYLYSFFLPLTILTCSKSIRAKSIAIFCCWREDSIYAKSAGRIISAAPKRRRTPLFKDKGEVRTRKRRNLVDYNTPVLFATSEGLHLRVVSSPSTENDLMAENLGNVPGGKKKGVFSEFPKSTWTSGPSFINEFCDRYMLISDREYRRLSSPSSSSLSQISLRSSSASSLHRRPLAQENVIIDLDEDNMTDDTNVEEDDESQQLSSTGSAAPLINPSPPDSANSKPKKKRRVTFNENVAVIPRRWYPVEFSFTGSMLESTTDSMGLARELFPESAHHAIEEDDEDEEEEERKKEKHHRQRRKSDAKPKKAHLPVTPGKAKKPSPKGSKKLPPLVAKKSASPLGAKKKASVGGSKKTSPVGSKKKSPKVSTGGRTNAWSQVSGTSSKKTPRHSRPPKTKTKKTKDPNDLEIENISLMSG